MLSRLLINFLPRSKHLSISWLQSASAVILEPKKLSLTLFPLFPYTTLFRSDRFDAEKILPMFAKHKITTFCAPPTMYRMLIKQDLSRFDLSSIRHASTAGEALNPEVYRQFKKHTGLSVKEGFGIWSHHFMANRWGNNGNSVRLNFLGSKITLDGDCSHEIKRRLLLGRKVMTNLDSIFKSRYITLPTKVF